MSTYMILTEAAARYAPLLRKPASEAQCAMLASLLDLMPYSPVKRWLLSNIDGRPLTAQTAFRFIKHLTPRRQWYVDRYEKIEWMVLRAATHAADTATPSQMTEIIHLIIETDFSDFLTDDGIKQHGLSRDLADSIIAFLKTVHDEQPILLDGDTMWLREWYLK